MEEIVLRDRVLCVAVLTVSGAFAQGVVPPDKMPEALKNIGIDQMLNSTLTLSLPFRDESGSVVPLKTYFQRKPVLLAFVYYRCPMLCDLVMNGVLRAARVLSFTAGKEYEIVFVSIDPRETPELAAQKKRSYLESYRRAGAEKGWHFLTGDGHSVKQLTGEAGFRYKYDPKTDQFGHASGIIVLTPEGRLSRYFYGVEYAPRDVRLAMIEAAQEHIGNPVDAVLLYCLHYDPSTGKYGLIIMNALRVGGAATLLALAAFWLAMYRRSRLREARP